MAGVCYRLKTRKRRSSLVSLHCFAALLAESGSGRNNRNNNNSNANGADDDDNDDDDDILVMDDAADRLNNAGLLPLNGGWRSGRNGRRAAESQCEQLRHVGRYLRVAALEDRRMGIQRERRLARRLLAPYKLYGHSHATSIQAQLSLVSLNSSLLTRCSLLLAQQGYAFRHRLGARTEHSSACGRPRLALLAVSKMRRENCFYRREEFSMIGLTGTLFAHSKGLWHGRADSHCADNNHKLRQRRRPQG